MSRTFSVRLPLKRLLATWLMVLQVLPPALYAGGALAQATLPITTDRGAAGQRPVVAVGANGVPIVQIAPPNGAGVSHNRYTDYNVGSSGVILNNSGANSQTQLGGWVGGNPMLGNSRARTILNEVTGSLSSRLNGPTEVAGNRANVIVANPNGISCNGCGFINAPRVTLTTGTPQFGADGSVSGFNVQRGQISIDGQGLNARDADQLDLIARSLRVNAEIWATRLQVGMGANQVDYVSGQTTAQAGSGDVPAVAIDVSQLGGMYANSIRLIGTESGVGVNSAGALAALTGDFDLSSAGDVRFAAGQIQAKGNLTIQGAQNISNAGTVYAEGNTVVNAGGNLNNTNLIAAAGSVQGAAASLGNAGIIGSGVNAQGQVALAGDTTLTMTGNLQSNGQILAGNNAALTANTIALDGGGKVNAGNQASVTAAGTLANHGELSADNALLNAGAVLDNSRGNIQAKTLSITAPRIDNTLGTILQTGNSNQLVLAAQQGIVNTQGRIAVNAANLTLAGSGINNVGGKIEHAGSGNLSIQTAGALTNTQGSIAGNGSTSLQAQSIANVDGTVQAQGTLAVTGDSGIDNTRGKLLTAGAAVLTTQGALNNSQGVLQANGALAAKIGTALNNTQGTILVNQLDLQAGSVSNVGGQILQSGTGNTTVAVTGAFNNAGGTLSSNAVNLNLSAGSVDNTAGLLSHAGAGALRLTSSGDVQNAGGQILASKALAISAQRLTNTVQANQAGLVQAGTTATIATTGDASNAGGRIVTGQTLDLQVRGNLNNAAGKLEAGQALNVVAASIDNTAGQLTSLDGSGLTARATQTLSNTLGFIGGNGAVTINAGTLTNNQGAVAGSGNLTITANAIGNTRGTIQSQQQLTLNAGSIGNTQNGLIQGALLNIAATSFNNASGATIQTGTGNTAIQVAGSLDNTDGKIAGNGADATLTAQSLDNTRGSIQHAGTGTLTVDGGSALINTAGTIAGNNNVTVTAATISNTAATINGNPTQGRIAAGNGLQVNAATTLNNNGGIVQGNGALRVTTPALTNAGGSILTNDLATLNVAQFDNRNGAIAANRLAVAATSIQNTGGQIVSLGSAVSNVNATQGINNTAGIVAGNGNLTLSGYSINNQGGTIQAANSGSLAVSAADVLDNSAAGKIASSGALVMQAGSVNNQNGQMTSGRTLNATVATALDNTQGTIAATGDVTVATGTVLTNNLGVIGSVQGNLTTTSGGSTSNTSGRLEAARDISVVAKAFANNQGTVAGGNTSINTQGQGLDNSGGKIAARNVLSIRSGQLANIGGLLQATGAMNIDTQGQTLTNTLSGVNGGIIGQNTITLNAGKLDNQAGFIGAVGAMAITANQVDNMQGGSVVGQNSIVLNGSSFNNTGGALQVQGDATFNLGSGTIDNSGSLLRSGGTLAVNAGTINNTTTQGANQGIEGASVNLAAATVNNAAGAIRADNQLTIAAAGTLDNTQGLVSSTRAATISAAAITNTAGTLIAGSNLSIDAGTLTGDGKLLSRGDMTVNLAGGFNNTNQVQANNNLNFTTQGNVVNSGLIRAGNILNLNAANLDNQAAGEISATTTNITVPGTINNQGLIDGATTRIVTGALNNTGRIYGDHVALQAGTLNNSITGVIASRVNMDLGVGNLTNSEHAIIYSAGNLNIGGGLTAQNLATGNAGTVTNASATIEAAGSMVLATNNLVNRNDHFSMTTQSLGTQQVAEYQPSGWTTRLPSGSVGFNSIDEGRLVLDDNRYPLARFGASGYRQAIGLQCEIDGSCTNFYTYTIADPVWALFGVTPPVPPPVAPVTYFTYCGGEFPQQFCLDYDAAIAAWSVATATKYDELDQAIRALNVNLGGRMFEDWYAYNIARTTSESVVQSSDPAKILAGGNLTLSGAVTNDKSQMIAGGTINGTAASINNIDAQGTRTVTDNGTVQFTEIVACGWDGGDHCRKSYAPGAYNPGAQVTPIGVPIALMQQNTTVSAGAAVPSTVVTPVVQPATGPTMPFAIVGPGKSIDGVAAVTAPSQLADPNPMYYALNAPVAGTAVAALPGPAQAAAIPGVRGRTGPNGTPMVVRTAVPVLTVPNNALFKTHAEPGAAYLIETDPRFANFRTWVSSDFMLQQLSRDPGTTTKRLGDGFYEQKLIAEQILLATGQRFIGNYTSNEDEYRALMQAGTAFGRQYQLNIGTALTEAQMQLLTTDLVWLVQKEVTLADGSKQTVLVPQVYVYVKEGDLRGDGTLIAGNDIRLNVTGDITNSGTIAGRSVTALTADNIRNIGGRIQGNSVALQAQTDLDNLSGTIAGNTTVTLQAGRDITLRTQTIDTIGQTGTRTGADRIATVYGSNITALAGRDLTIAGAQVTASGDIVLAANRHATIDAVRTADNLDLAVSGHISQQSVQHIGSQIGAGGNLVLAAGQQGNGNLLIRGSELSAGGDLTAIGSNVSVQSVIDARDIDMVTQLKHGTNSIKEHTESAVGGQINANGSVTIAATGGTGSGNLRFTGAQVASAGAVVLAANNNLDIVEQQLNQSRHTESTSSHHNLLSSGNSTSTTDSRSQTSIGSSVAGDRVAIQSGNDVTLRGGSILGINDVSLSAKNDISILAAQEKSSGSNFTQSSSTATGLGKVMGATAVMGGDIYLGAAMMGSKAIKQNTEQIATQAIGSTISGGNIHIDSARDTRIEGSTIVADANIDIAAGRNLSIVSAQQMQSQQSAGSSRTSGFVGSALQPAAGVVKQSSTDNTTSVTQVGSQIASLGTNGSGNVTLKAGQQYTQTASQVIAPQGDIAIAAKNVLINEAYSTSNAQQHNEYSKVAIGGTVSVPLISAIQGVAGMVQAVKNTGDSRMQALGAVNAAMNAKDAIDTAQALSGGNLGGIKFSVSLGSTNSENNSSQIASAVVGSTVAAGGNVTINATGDGSASNLTAIASDIRAGNSASLQADNRITLQAARSSLTEQSDNQSSGASIGIGFAIGGQQNGFTLELAANKARGDANGTDSTATNTHLQAGNIARLQSGGDTTLQGAVVKANTVQADIGGNLKIESLQDSSQFDSKQTSAGIGISLCIPPFCYGASSVSGSFSKSNVNGDYLGVVEQSGIKAGDGGFTVKVKGDTTLTGAVIASTQGAIDQHKNSLSTASLVQTDLQNKDTFDADGFGISATVSGKLGDQGSATTTKDKDTVNNATSRPSASGGVGSSQGNQTSTTRSGISDGAITITDDARQQSLTGQDAATTIASLTPGITTDSNTAGTLVKAWNGKKLQEEIQAQVAITQAFSQLAPKAVANYADSQAAALRKQGNEDEAQKWDEGGVYRVALHTAAGALGGGVAGAAGAAAVAGFAPLLNELQANTEAALIKQGMSEGAAKMIAQGLAQATSLGIGAAVGGAQGAAIGLAVDTNNRQLHPTEIKWIKDNAKRYAALHPGMTEAEAEKRLANQAFREVQFGAVGDTDVAARTFLKKGTEGMLLPGDPTIPGQNVGYMFYATPEQKANANMYLNQVLASPQAISFYKRNQITQPSLQQILNAAQLNGSQRADVLNKTVLAAAAAGALVLAPALAGVAAELAAFGKNPIGYCLGNPAGCGVATEIVTCAIAGPACPTGSMMPNVGSIAKVVEKEVGAAVKVANLAANQAKIGANTAERLTGPLSAEGANAAHLSKGNRPPYADGTRARDIVLNDERTFVRVHGEDNQARSWMMRPNEIEGLNAQQIQNKFALPELPTYISDVYAPAGSRIRLGTVGAQEGWGAGGGIQYELLQRLPGSAFRNMRPLP